MADVTNPKLAANQSALLELFQEGLTIVQSASPRESERLAELTRQTAASYIGRIVDIVPIDRETKPITALYYATPYPRFGTPGYRERGYSTLSRPNPRWAVGTISDLSLEEAELEVTPRRWSPYRFDRGRFLVQILNSDKEPLVYIGLDGQEPDDSGRFPYTTIEVPEPTIEEVLEEYRGYRKMGGALIDEFERQLDDYVEPPSIAARIKAIGSRVVGALRSKA